MITRANAADITTPERYSMAGAKQLMTRIAVPYQDRQSYFEVRNKYYY